MRDALEDKFRAIECESGNVEEQWNNIKKCVLYIVSDGDGRKEAMDYIGNDQ